MTKYTIQYRQMREEGMLEGETLKSLLVRAMRLEVAGAQLGANAKARIIDLDQDGTYVILNKISDPAAWDQRFFAGQLIHLRRGADVAAVLQSLEDDTEEFLLEQVNIGEDASVLKGILYFATVDNHLGLIEDQQVRGRTLERYLTAVLQRADLLEAGRAVVLNASFRAGDGKELAETSEVTIFADKNYGPAAAAAVAVVDQIVEDEVARLRREGASVFDVLRTLGWDEQAITSLEGEVPNDGWIEGFFKVFIKTRRRRQPISRATINEALRNIDPQDIGLDGEGRERGGIVKLSTRKGIRTVGTLKDPADAIEKIMQALQEWAEAGKIDCAFDA